MTPEKAEAWRKYRERGFWQAWWPFATISGVVVLTTTVNIGRGRATPDNTTGAMVFGAVFATAAALLASTAVFRAHWCLQEWRYRRAVAAAPPAEP